MEAQESRLDHSKNRARHLGSELRGSASDCSLPGGRCPSSPGTRPSYRFCCSLLLLRGCPDLPGGFLFNMLLTVSCGGAKSSAVAVEWERCSVAAAQALAVPFAGLPPLLSVEDGGGDGTQSLGFQSILTGWGLGGGLSPIVGELKAVWTFPKQPSTSLAQKWGRGRWLSDCVT